MNRNGLVRAGLSGLLLCGVSAGPITQPADTKPTDEVTRLTRELGFQNQKVENLLKQNSELEAQVRQLQVKLAMEKTAQPGMEGKQIPRDWVTKEFNGTPYYLVPLTGAQSAPVIAK